MAADCFCWVFLDLSDQEVMIVRQLLHEEKLVAKAAVIGRQGNRFRMEVCTLKEKSWRYLLAKVQLRIKRRPDVVEIV